MPRTHNIEFIANRIEDSSLISFDKGKNIFFRTLSKYYIADRYPDFMSMAGELVSKEEAALILCKTKEMFAWLLTLKPSEN